MVTVAVVGIGSALTSGLTGGAAVAGAIAVAGATALATYVDQRYVYPALFGKKDPKPDALEGFQISTTDPGAPRWEVYGSRAWTPAHYLWSLNVRDVPSQGGGGGKGGASRPFIHTVRADVGLGVSDGSIRSIEALYADERPFWATELNRAAAQDSRWSIEPGTGANTGKLHIFCLEVTLLDFTGVFRIGDMARLEGVSPQSLNGYYRVTNLATHGSQFFSNIVLDPLEQQPVGFGTAGTVENPASLRRIDYGFAFPFDFAPVTTFNKIFLNGTYLHLAADGADPDDDIFQPERWQVGSRYRLTNFTQPGEGEGLWELRLFDRRKQITAFGTIAPFWHFELVPGGNPVTGAGVNFTAAQPLIMVRDQDQGFSFFDSQQDFVVYPGTREQPQDPTLAALEPDAPAHRGIAHISLSDWNLGPHGNIFPRVTALVQSRKYETIASAIKRICGRTMAEPLSDVTGLRRRQLLGYSIPGGLASGQALQPLLAFFGVAMQDRGGVETFLDEQDLPVIAVATRHLNARPASERTQLRGFSATRVDEALIPERVLISYIDPAEGADESEGYGQRAPGSPDRGSRDTLKLDFKPLVAWPHDVKRRARELDRRVRMETHRGQLRLPPGYMDVLPGHIVTFAANNHEDETLPAGPTVAFDTHLRDLIPDTVALQVRFSGGEVATLLDNGSGALEGFPAGITASVNTVDYAAGRIELLCSEALDDEFEPVLTYRYEREWVMRANKATLSGYDFGVTCDVVSTTTDGPLPPLPRRLPGIGAPIASELPEYLVEILDVPPIYSGQSRAVWLGFAIAPDVGSQWRGATVYQSPNGVDRWTAIGQAQQPSTIGSMPTNTLPDRSAAHPGVIDWETEVTVDIPGGELLEDATLDQIGAGRNWALIGDEIVAFHEAEAQAGTEWTLRGLVRGLRHTIRAMDTHADGDRFVLLTALGALHGFLHEAAGGYAAANRTYHFRVVPGGSSIDAVDTLSLLIQGKSARPAPPLLEYDMVAKADPSGDITVDWWRRSTDQTNVFGAIPMDPGQVEQYEVVAFDADEMPTLIATLGLDGAVEATALRRWIVGGSGMGTPLTDRSIDYPAADQAVDGLSFGDNVGFVVYQLGAAGRSEASGDVTVELT